MLKCYQKHLQEGGWRKVAALYKVSPGIVYTFAVHGIEPARPDLRAKLGLPARALAPVCPKCGVVHTTKRCTAGRKAQRKRTNWKGIARMLMAAWAAKAREK